MTKPQHINIYTANYGNYDILKEQPKLDNVTYTCFTDNPNLKSNSWEIVYNGTIMPDSCPRMKAKFFKVMSHKLFPDETLSIWVDSSYVIVNSKFVSVLTSFLTSNGFAIYKHPYRQCIYQELLTSVAYPKYFKSDVRGQVNDYKKEGMPQNFGLWAAGLIVRVNNENVKKINSLWWEEIKKYTFQDQLSLPFVIWKNNLKIDTINLPQYDKKLYVITEHLRPNE